MYNATYSSYFNWSFKLDNAFSETSERFSSDDKISQEEFQEATSS